MRRKAASMTALALAGFALVPSMAAAHFGVTSGPGIADATQKITFGAGHGCEGADTVSVQIDIPAGVSSVRAVPSTFGKVKVNRDAAQIITSVTWTRNEADLSEFDEHFYEFTLRVKLPNTPFTAIYFPTHQVCRTKDGKEITSDWVASTQNDSEGADAPKPAPAVIVLPARKPGWNKYTVPNAVPAENMAHLFADAQIVWKGNSAYSANPNTVQQISTTDGASPLTSLAAGDEIWVKY